MLNYIVWNVDPTFFTWPVTVRWYGMMFAIGFWIGFNIVSRMFKREGAPESWLGVLLLWVAAGTIIGARLGHVLFYEWSYYSQHPMKILAIWEGGLASHGGAIGVIIGVIMFSIFTTKRNPLWTFDRLVVAIALVGCLIRIGNLMNSKYSVMPQICPGALCSCVRASGMPCMRVRLCTPRRYMKRCVIWRCLAC